MKKRWPAHIWAATLAQQCKNRENQAKNKNIYSLLFKIRGFLNFYVSS